MRTAVTDPAATKLSKSATTAGSDKVSANKNNIIQPESKGIQTPKNYALTTNENFENTSSQEPKDSEKVPQIVHNFLKTVGEAIKTIGAKSSNLINGNKALSESASNSPSQSLGLKENTNTPSAVPSGSLISTEAETPNKAFDMDSSLKSATSSVLCDLLETMKSDTPNVNESLMQSVGSSIDRYFSKNA